MPLLSNHKFPHLMMFLAIGFMLMSLNLYQLDKDFILEWNIININSASINFPILLGANNTLFMFTVSFISFNVLIFSKAYMANEINLQRFTHMVMLFITSMFALILSPNTMTMLLGWDGLGITSFLLVIFYENPKSLKSGMITIISNRIGDCMILFSIALMLSQGHWNMLNTWSETISFPTLMMSFLLLAAMTKSAQFPFMAWLTCAMAAPTPVSALVHSSTLVTAGVYILIQFYPFLSEFDLFSCLLMTTGTITMVIGAAWGIAKKDIKETIALSTMSQLGLMMMTLSMGMVDMCFFHVLTHAMFKATMFMAAGMVIMFKSHRQNFSNIKMKTNSRSTAIALMMSILSMNALFFTSGYYSKDTILEEVWYSPAMLTTVILFMASTAMTMTYSLRLWRACISTKTKSKTFIRKNVPQHIIKTHIVSNNYILMEVPLLSMTLASIIMGSVVLSLVHSPSDTPILPLQLQGQSPFLVMIGVGTAMGFCPSNKGKDPGMSIFKIISKTLVKSFKWTFKKQPSLDKLKFNMFKSCLMQKKTIPIFTKFSLFQKNMKVHKENKQALDAMSKHSPSAFVRTNYMIARPFLKLSLAIEKFIDLGLFTFIGPSAISKSSQTMSSNSMMPQNSSTNSMLFMFLIFSTIIIFTLS